MAFFTQLTQLLSEPPGTLVFHLVTLFALQAILGMALHQWRQNRTDRTARRMAVAAGVIFLAQGVLLILGLLWQNSPATAVAYLPPLTQTSHALTAVFITWALAAHRQRFTNFSNALLVAVLITLVVMTISFMQEWQRQLPTQLYAETPQTLIGGIFQLSVLAVGFLVSLLHREGRQSLRPLILLILIAAHVAQLSWGQPVTIPGDTNAVFWLRLSYLIAFPMWAVQVYRRLLDAPQQTPSSGAVAARSGEWLDLLPHLTDVVGSLHPQPTMLAAIDLIAEAIQAKFIGLALADEQDPTLLQVTTNLPQAGRDTPRTWTLKLENWPAFRLAREQGTGVELRASGIGARQLHLLYDELGLSTSLGAVYVHPLRAKSEWLGLLILSHPHGENSWTEEQRAAISPLADYVAQAIDNSRLHVSALQKPNGAFTLDDVPDTGRLINLEEDHKRLQQELETWQARARQAEGRAAEARKQAQDLANTLQELERVNRSEKVQALETEIEALRESLMAAEEAMAMAAASESDLSTEWVMLTITRYSSQLEEAQTQIEKLEAQLKQLESASPDTAVLQTLQEIRTPMTSIVSYAEMLLADSKNSAFSQEQQTFAEHIRSNAQRVETLLKQLTEQFAVHDGDAQSKKQVTNLAEVLETAVHTVITHVRENHQRLAINVAQDLPSLAINQETLQQIMARLLENATHAAGEKGLIRISAQAKALGAPLRDEQEEILKFVHITVEDTGSGISMADRAYVFAPPPSGTDQPLSGLGSSYQQLAEARNLAVAHGARMWVDGELGTGSTFSLLFPIATTEIPAPSPKPGSNGVG